MVSEYTTGKVFSLRKFKMSTIIHDSSDYTCLNLDPAANIVPLPSLVFEALQIGNDMNL